MSLSLNQVLHSNFRTGLVNAFWLCCNLNRLTNDLVNCNGIYQHLRLSFQCGKEEHMIKSLI